MILKLKSYYLRSLKKALYKRFEFSLTYYYNYI